MKQQSMTLLSKLIFQALLLIGVLIFTVPSAQSQPAESNDDSNSYLALYEQLINLSPDETQIADVRDLTLKRDVATFHLTEGSLILLKPIEEAVMGAAFIGKGSVTVTPPTEIEREQLFRFQKVNSLEKQFDFLFLIFADTTLTELQRKLAFATGSVGLTLEGQIENAIKFLSDKKGKYFDTAILKTLFDGQQNGLFYTHFSKDNRRPMFFSIDPYAVEEVSLLQRAETAHFDKQNEVVCKFHQAADYDNDIDLTNESKSLLRIEQYNIESTIAGNLDFSASARLDFQSLQEGQKWIYLTLFSDMEVDTVRWSTGETATFFKNKDNPFLRIKCDPALDIESRQIRITYHGNLIERDLNAWIYIKSPLGWYPRYGGRQNAATFDLTFHAPKNFRLVSVGEMQYENEQGRTTSTRWVTQEPIRLASFNLGLYKDHEIDDDRVAPITVLMSKGGHIGNDELKEVAADMANSLAFFEHVYGKIPIKRFYATETPYRHGLAFPGMIHMSASTFLKTNRKGYDEVFRAHEVAHQWWGIGVDFKTYHDQWLSEGLSDFSGLWYMQTVLEDQKKYLNVLKDWRERILSNRKYLIGSGREAGPIWLGYRTSTSQTSGDYGLIIYQKGAWVFHMLRMMLLDMTTMNEDRFTNMMREFYTKYKGQSASTEDFRATVEKHFGGDLGWFFRQWIYKTDIPTYEFSYSTEKRADGKYLVKCRVKQSEVPEDFQMLVPLRIEFKTGQFVNIRRMIKGPVTEFDLPLLQMKPKKIKFNYLDAVLCKAKEVAWK